MKVTGCISENQKKTVRKILSSAKKNPYTTVIQNFNTMKVIERMTSKEFENMNKMMMRQAKYYLHSDIDADEVVGKVIEKIALGKFNVSSVDELKKVLKTAVKYACFDFKRSRFFKMREKGKVFSLDASYIQVRYEEENENLNDREAIFSLLDSEMDKLTEKEAKLIRLKYMDGYSYDEIVPMLGGNVKSLCVMAGRILRKLEDRMSA
jgi:RNA polymerase sigma factor (sigma-70 family)